VRSSTERAVADGRVDPASFEARYRQDPDPWGFAASAYEQDKYDHTVRALVGVRYGRALELGCSIGVLTERLAPCCQELVAVDASPTAVAAAQARTAGLAHVTARVAVLPEALPEGPWNLVVASELLYYFTPPLLSVLLDGLEASLVAGGTLLAVHYTRDAPDHRLSGDAVHELLLDRPALEPVAGARAPGYRLDRLRRR
jgi:cyclopropane fatty-acyl-phospholipid synthase-like methyltransferase